MTARVFVRHGPAIPTELLHALEEDRLVFFCGAGISMDTGLPGFAGLVKDVLDKRSYFLDADVAMQDAFCREQFDKVLEIVEQRKESPGNWMMRRAVIARLVEPPTDDAQLNLHRAILTLARRRDHEGYRLVTTNFDDRFELAGVETSRIEQAPRLSPPSRRDLVNVVHLHGRIDKTQPEATGTDLVLTTADFGNAYLHHGWAARFVIELFREFTVLFIGYGLNDPVMRYLVDALAATPSRFRKAYALASYRAAKAGDQDRQHALWSAKNVEPILYAEDHPEHPRHALLRETLVAWAAEREARLTGRLTVAVRATANPFVAGQNEASDPDGVNAVAWALSDLNGGVARQFADAKPVPDPSWWAPVLAATVRDPRDPEETCRLINLKEVAKALATWGCRCLATPEVTAWTIDQQGSTFRELLDRLPWALSRTEAEHVVPEPYRRFWEIVLHLSGQRPNSEADWRHELPHEGGRLTRKGREILLRRLRPRLSMTKPWRFMPGEEQEAIQTLAHLATIEINFAAAYPDLSIVEALQSVPSDATARGELLAGLADDLTSALLDHLRLGELADLTFASGASYHQRQQIAKALDGITHDDWRILVDLLAETVTSGKEVAPELIEPCCRRWHLLWKIHGYSLFLRLWLFAVSDWDRLDIGLAIDLVSQPEHLWGFELRSEVLRLLAERGSEIDVGRLEALAAQLKAGPPRSSRYENLSEEEFADYGRKMRGDRLAALATTGIELEELSAEQQEASRYVREQRDHLASEGYRLGEYGVPLWTSTTVSYVESPSAEHLVDKPASEVAQAIIDYRDEYGREERAEKLFIDFLMRAPARAAEVSEKLLELGEGRAEVWRGLWRGLNRIEEPSPVVPLAATLSALIEQHDLLVSAETIRAFCDVVAKLADTDLVEDLLWKLWDRAVPIAQKYGSSGQLSGDDGLDRAINAPGGVLAKALLSRLGKASQKAEAGFPDPIRARLYQLVEDSGDLGRYGRILLASRLRWLHHLDPAWTRRVLIDRMAWSSGDLEETGRLWRGYLFSPRISPGLLDDLKPMLLKAPEHRNRLGEQFDQLCHLITAITCIEAPDRFSRNEKQEVIRAMGPEGLGHGVWLLERRLAGAEGAAELWHSRVGPWFEQCWPDDRAFHDQPVLQRIDELLLETREAFAEALTTLRNKSLVQHHEVGWMVLRTLVDPEKGRADDEPAFDYIQTFPREVIIWLDCALAGNPLSPDRRCSLVKVLSRAVDADPDVTDILEYQRLKTLTA